MIDSKDQCNYTLRGVKKSLEFVHSDAIHTKDAIFNKLISSYCDEEATPAERLFYNQLNEMITGTTDYIKERVAQQDLKQAKQ